MLQSQRPNKEVFSNRLNCLFTYKALSTLSPKTATVAENDDCRTFRRLSQKTATVAEFGDGHGHRKRRLSPISFVRQSPFCATVADFGDKLSPLSPSGQALRPPGEAVPQPLWASSREKSVPRGSSDDACPRVGSHMTSCLKSFYWLIFTELIKC